MVCRCSSPQEHAARAAAATADYDRRRAEDARAKIARLEREIAALTPDPKKWEFGRVEEVGPHLVAEVQYPACEHAGYGGLKLMVFLNVGLQHAIRWKVIDPHFQEPYEASNPTVAPVPAARFPANVNGWADAVAYARSKEP